MKNKTSKSFWNRFSRINSVQTKFLIWLIPILSFLLLLMFGTMYVQQRRDRKRQVEEQSLALIESGGGQINFWLEALKREMEQLTKRYVVKSGKWENMKDAFVEIANERSEDYGFLIYVEKDGTYYETISGGLAMNNDGSAKTLIDKEYFKEVFKNGKDFSISNPYHSVTNGKGIFVVLIPVKSDSGEVIGAVGGVIYLSRLSDIAQTIQIGEDGYGWMTDNTGLITAHADSSYILKLNLLTSSSVGFKDLDILGKEMQSNHSGSGFITVPDGSQKYVVYSTISETNDWKIGVSIPNSYIYDELISLLYQFFLFYLFTISIAIVIIWILSQSIIARPLKKIISYTSTIAEGHLYNKIELKSNDEVGRMAFSLSEMADKIRNIVENIRDSANHISDSSHQLNEAANQIAQGANEQASSSEEISSSMEEMVAAFNQNSENAQETEKIALSAAANIEKVALATNKSVVSVREIAQKIKMVGDIAEKTDLLAINAAVEAARAGEYGKGFAVVAAEVRKLAEYSQKAAAEIIELSLSSLQVTEDAGKLMDAILPDIQKNAELVREISVASVEQNAGANQINTAIQQFSMVTQQNAASAEELATGSDELSSQAEALKEAVAYFKINENELNSVTKIFELIDKHNNEITKLKNQLTQFESSKSKLKYKEIRKTNINSESTIDLSDKTDDGFTEY